MKKGTLRFVSGFVSRSGCFREFGTQYQGSSSQDVPAYGPAKGTLVIVGGARSINTGIIWKVHSIG